METAFIWVTVVVSWLVTVTGGIAVVAGILLLVDKLLYHILEETQALTALAEFVRNREDFRKYKRDRVAWEIELQKARDKWNEKIRESMTWTEDGWK